MAIYLTGDTHGDFSRFGRKGFSELNSLTKNDYVLICGDFGGIWDGGSAEQTALDWLDARPFTTLFVDGNHENFDLLKTYPAIPWHGGAAQRIRPTVLHLLRGQVYTLEGLRFFTMGGGRSHDIDDGILEPDDPLFRQKRRWLDASQALYRINHRSWWKEELPCEAEYRTARDNLEQNDWTVDCVVSHCAPTSIQQKLLNGTSVPDSLTEFLEDISQRCRFRHWFFGHYHMDGHVGDQFIYLYQELIQLTGSDHGVGGE